MKKIIQISSILLIAAILLSLLAMTASAAEGYSGTPVTPTKINSDNYRSYGFTADNWQEYDGYYAITSAEELYGFANIVNQKNQSGTGACAVLINDIVVNTGTVTAAGSSSGTTYNWTPIANNYNNDYNYYKGTFDGRGHTISGLYVGDATVKPVGLFGALGQKGAEATVKNVIIANSYFTGAGCVGAIAGHVQGAAILNCKIASDVTVSCNGSVGGIAGMVAWSCEINITNCVNFGKVVGSNTNGRDVGAILGSTMSNSGSYVKISGCYYIAGNTTANGGAQAGVGNNMNSNDNGTTGIASASATHTCTGMEHPEIPSSCFKKGVTAYTDCMICGTIISGTKSEIDYQHFYLDATCTDPATCADCGATTGGVNADNHTAAPTYSANADDAEKHDKNYSCCSIVIPEPHSFDSGNTCICNAQAVASVTIGGATQYYMDIQNVVTVVKEAAQLPYVKLFADITLTDTLTFENAPKGMELDFAGKTIYNPNNVALKWGDHWVTNNGTLTLRDSVGGGGVTSGRFSALELDEDAVIYGGTFKASMDDKFTQAAAIDVYEATVSIYGGVFDATDSAIMTIDGTVNIYGGSFECRTGIFDIRNAGVIQVYAAEFPNGIAKESKHSVYAVLLSEVLAPDCYLKDAEGNLISTEGDVYAVSGACTVSAGADLKDAAVTVNATHTYIGAEIKPDIIVTIHGRVIDPANYTITYSNNINVGTATVTVTGKGIYSGENATEFTITKGNLAVATNPETTYEFGAAVGDVVSGGKVVINGNESAVITGTWAWVEQGQTAVFTPDAQYIDLFNELTNVTVTHVVTPATPVIEVVTPSSSIMPGMAIRMSVVVKNPHNGELTDLPTAFRVTYKIGENGTPVTVDGLEFTLPTTGVVLGDKVYVTVENVAVDGKYTVAVSTNTIELAVGQVDYTGDVNNLQNAIDKVVADLEKAQQELQEAIDTNTGNIAALTTELTNKYNELVALLGQLPDGVASMSAYVEKINTALTAADQVLQEAIDKVASDLEKAQQELQEAIDTNTDNIAALTTELTNKYNELVALIGQLPDGVASMSAYVEKINTALTAADKVLQEAIDKVASDLANAEKELTDAMNAGDKALDDKIAALNTALENAITAYKAADASLRADLSAQISSVSTSLRAMISQVSDNLDQAQMELTEAMNAGDAALTEKIEALQAAMEAAIAANAAADEATKAELVAMIEESDAALKAAMEAAIAANAAADEAAKAELVAKIEEADAALQTAIDKVSADLVEAKQELSAAIAAGDEALDAKVEELTNALNAAKAALEAADQENKTALTTAIEEAYATLNTAIEVVRQELANAKAALEKADADNKAAFEKAMAENKAALEKADADNKAAFEKAMAENKTAMEAKDQQLQTFIIVVCSISGVALCGSAAFVIWFFLGRKKRIV